MLDPDEQGALAGLVRRAIARGAADRKDLDPRILEDVCAAFPRLRAPRGAFVTVYVQGELRGCLGEIEPRLSLAEVAAQCGSRAARADRRFEPVRPAELPQSTFRISVLDEPKPVGALDEIRIGRDGLIVRHQGRTGLLLPEVASERGWDARTFAQHLWRKAGIEPEVKPEEAVLLKFETQAIRGEDFPER